MDKLSIAICDDEKEIRDDLARLVKSAFSDSVITTYVSGTALISDGASFDAYLLDIEMPGENGMEIAKRIRQDDKDAIIVFVTGYEGYMQDAFDVRAFHYLLKPVHENKLREVLLRAVSEKERNSSKEPASLLIKKAGVSQKVYLEDITHIESNNKKVLLHLSDGSRMEMYARMEAMESILDGSFFRCHRFFIVNMKYITAYSADEIMLDGNQRVLMSGRKYADFVKEYLRYNRGSIHVTS